MEHLEATVGRLGTGRGSVLSRRGLFGAAGAAAAASILVGCTRRNAGDPPRSAQADWSDDDSRRGRLRERPRRPTATEAELGLQPLRLGGGRDGFIFVPADYHVDQPLPLVVVLHGAGGAAIDGLAPFRDHADESGFMLLAPESRGRTWDVLLGGYGPDVHFIDRALAHTFSRYAVAPDRITVEGFSDGASYALGLGLANGDLFQRIVAFSPGFVPSARPEGHPQVYVSHGTSDEVLPIERCSRRIVPALEKAGYDVRFNEFAGGHEVPAHIVDDALAWLRLPRQRPADGRELRPTFTTALPRRLTPT